MATYIEKEFVCNDYDTVVDTVSGKVKGYRYDGINYFLGIPYAEADRFMPPHPVPKWNGIRDALSYGYTCPRLETEALWSNLVVPKRAYPQSENCQNLNIWTPSLNKEEKLPVVVWIHGGGFTWGSTVELKCYDGNNMAKHGNVVCVSINHRLNSLGYLDLSSFGDKYKNTGNCGGEDLIAALEWIQDNISSFGGDPNCVTIVGQSGGGGKVATLMQSPAADGLFHRAIMMSGSGLQGSRPRMDREIALCMLRYLNINSIDELQQVPLKEFIAATNIALKQTERKQESILDALRFEPTPNDTYKGEPLLVGWREHAKKIPLMLGNVFAEFNMRAVMPNKRHASENEIYAYLNEIFGDATDRIIEEFKKAYPEKSLGDLGALDHVFRPPTIAVADLRAKDGCSNTYVYMNAFEAPQDDGLPMWHCGDLDFLFHNAELSPIHQIPGYTSEFQEKVFTSFMTFARTGNPNNALIPNWPEYKKGSEYTMVFDKTVEPKLDYDRELVTDVAMHRHHDTLIDF